MAQAQAHARPSHPPALRGAQTAARAYLWLVAALPALALAALLEDQPRLEPDDLFLVASLAALAVVAQHFPIQVGPQHKVDCSLAAYVAAVVLLPPAAAVLLVGVGQALGQGTLALRRDPATGRRRRGLRGVLFNTGQVMLATWLGSVVHAALGAAPLLAVPAAVVVLYVTNYAAVQVMLALQRPPASRADLAAWADSALSGLVDQAPEFAVLGLLGVVGALAARQSPLAPLLAALPTAAVYVLQRRSVEAIAREQAARQSAEAAEASSRALRERTARVLDAVLEAIIETDADGGVVYANPAAGCLAGAAPGDMVGRHIRDLLVTADAGEGRVRHADGGLVPVEYAATPVAEAGSGAVFVLHDLTARKAAEAQREALARNEKLRALGQMASGIAHDLNQSLALITGYLQMARESLEARPTTLDTAREYLDVALGGAHGGGQTVRRLLSWARTSPPDRRDRVDVGALLGGVADLTAPRWRDTTQAEGRPVHLTVEAAPGLYVVGDAAALREALTNLVFNAVDALPDGGRIVLRSRPAADGMVVVEVADTGAGIPPEVQARVFDPFFTTKGERGTGLGLAQVASAVEQHDGRLELDSAPGRGTTFRLSLPAAPAAPPTHPPTHPPAQRGAARRRLRILAVDDEERLARLAAQLLGARGHVVVVATSGEQAVDALGREAFDVVVSDLGMGEGMNGWDLAKHVKEHHPGVRVVLATGWGAGLREEEAANHGVDAVIAKPYAADDLREVVARVAE